MRNNIRKTFFLPLMLTLLLAGFITPGCKIAPDQIPFIASSNNKLAALMVPDTNLDFYLYARQEKPTTVPANMIKMPMDVAVDTMAIWGVPSTEGLTLGMAFTFDNATTASDIFSRITLDQNWWKYLRDNMIYLIQGSGNASLLLREVISTNDFKYYNDTRVLESVLIFPNTGRNKIIALAAAKPSDQVIAFLATMVDAKNLNLINNLTKQVNLDFIIAGLYSPHQINIARASEILKEGNNISSLDLGGLILVKSNFPGFMVGPAVKNVLNEYGFVEKKLGNFSLYRGLWSTKNNNVIPVFIRVEDNYIFISISGQETYAETLITSIYK